MFFQGFYQAKFLKVKSGIKLICRGFIYGRQSEHKNRTHWRCTRRLQYNEQCKARAITYAEFPGRVKLTSRDHNHESNLDTFLERNSMWSDCSPAEEFIPIVQMQDPLTNFIGTDN